MSSDSTILTQASSMSNLVSTAESICGKLSRHGVAADSILSELTSLNEEIKSMKEYSDVINNLNETSHNVRNKPRVALVQALQQESRYIAKLQKENKELRIVLKEQQDAIELIMSKYREHVTKIQAEMGTKNSLKLASGGDYFCASNNTTWKTNNNASEPAVVRELNEMKSIMRESIKLDEESILREEELISRLHTENRGLRELLNISFSIGDGAANGNVHSDQTLSNMNSTPISAMKNVEVQTE